MNLYLIDICCPIISNNNIMAFPDTFTLEQANKQIKKIRKLIKDESAFLIFYAFGEKWCSDAFNFVLNYYDIPYDHPRIFFVLDELNDSLDNYKIRFANWVKYSSQLMKVGIYEEIYGYNSIINLDTKKFLYLMGKPYKRWRIKTLYNLYKENLLEKSLYSFYLDFAYSDSKNTTEFTRNALPELSDYEYNEFVSKTLRELDTENKNYWEVVGLHVDITLYQNTSFSLVSETICDFKEPWFISEKTWRTIANKHCFVPLYTGVMFDYVHSLGIDTFQDILPIYKNQSFDKSQPYPSYVDNVIDNAIINVKFLLESIQDNKKYVYEKINHNYDIYKEQFKNHRKMIPKELESLIGFSYNYDCPISYTSLRKIDDANLSKTIVKKIWG